MDAKLDELVKNGLDQIVVSVDGSTPKLHDSLRGIKGLWNRIDKTLERIAKDYPSLHTRVNTVVSEKNLSDLANLAKWLDRRNVEQWSIIPIKLDTHKWGETKTLEEFKQEYLNFQKAIKNCKIELMGYSANWAGIVEDFWKGNSYIRPKNKCYLTDIVAFYDPFIDHIYPCNCVPHRRLTFGNREEEKNWYFEHGCEFCNGCEPLNAYCADFPNKIDENIFNF